MPSKMRDTILVSMTVIGLLFASPILCYADTTNYIYDEVNRLKRVEYEDGTVVEYFYDSVGNRTEVRVQAPDTTPPTGTIVINAGAAFTNNTTVMLTLSCDDASGCSEMQFKNDGSDYSNPEPYTTSKSWTLPSGDGNKSVSVKFKDTPGHWSTPYSSSILLDTIPPISSASPPGGTYGASQDVILSCNDGSGSGCYKICYTLDGSTPDCSIFYSGPIHISTTTTLKYFATDLAGNTESQSLHTENYFVNTGGGCPDPPVKIGSTFYPSLQSAYNAAINGDIIRSRAITFAENLTINRNVAVTLDGGYDCGCTNNVGGQTTLQGTLTTTSGGGTLTIKNFILGVVVLPDTTPPVTTPTPGEGTYGSAIDVTLSCSDGSGSGCYKTYYGLNGLDPTTEYSAPIHISASTTLKFYSTDLASNNETVKIQNYTIGGGCSNPPVKLGSTYYNTLQAAYNAANNGDTIKSRNVTLNENLTINQNIGVTLEGGYDCEFMSNSGGATTIKGALTTTSGGGTLTIRNFVLSN